MANENPFSDNFDGKESLPESDRKINSPKNNLGVKATTQEGQISPANEQLAKQTQDEEIFKYILNRQRLKQYSHSPALRAKMKSEDKSLLNLEPEEKYKEKFPRLSAMEISALLELRQKFKKGWFLAKDCGTERTYIPKLVIEKYLKVDTTKRPRSYKVKKLKNFGPKPT